MLQIDCGIRWIGSCSNLVTRNAQLLDKQQMSHLKKKKIDFGFIQAIDDCKWIWSWNCLFITSLESKLIASKWINEQKQCNFNTHVMVYPKKKNLQTLKSDLYDSSICRVATDKGELRMNLQSVILKWVCIFSIFQ